LFKVKLECDLLTIAYLVWVTGDKELKILVEECSNQDKHVYARRPDANGQPVAAAAWAKIDQGEPTLLAKKSCIRQH
jgi:hypothetical protein